MDEAPDHLLDARGLLCPLPIVLAGREAARLGPGALLEILADDPVFELDLRAWCAKAGHRLTRLVDEAGHRRARVRVGGGNPARPRALE
jgi:tRNA 2-thiouridine synthesizing protein A